MRNDKDRADSVAALGAKEPPMKGFLPSPAAIFILEPLNNHRDFDLGDIDQSPHGIGRLLAALALMSGH